MKIISLLELYLLGGATMYELECVTNIELECQSNQYDCSPFLGACYPEAEGCCGPDCNPN